MLFTLSAFRRMIRVDRKLLIQQMEFVGNRSFTITVMAAIMVGAVFGLQFGQIFRIFGVESLIGAAAAFSLSKELSPVVGAFLVTGRAGAAMAAEIATMKVNEQIDAMKVMSVNPITYLASPRILATMLMMPLLSAIFTLCGVISAFVIGVLIFDVDKGIFVDKISWITRPDDVFEGFEKAVIFGGIFSSVSCYKGFTASGGAKGVGRITTEAVVVSLVVILISDFFISYFHQRSIF
jgi:phospholipid/cholesterol/gamma-HCH transport system permease protein